MKKLLALAVLVAAPPAVAQTYYPDPRAYRDDRLTRDEYYTCVDRERALSARRGRIDDERSEVDREAEKIARAGAALDAQMRALDKNDATAVAQYNAKSERHNARVDRQNRHVADVNARAALLNGDAADMNARCEGRIYTPQPRGDDYRDRSTFR